MKTTRTFFAFLVALFCQPIFAQQSILDEFVPGVRWGMSANELAESRPNIFTDNNLNQKVGVGSAKSEQLDGNPMVSVQYQFTSPDTLGLLGVEFSCIDRESALETARKFGAGNMENNSTHFWKMDDGSAVTMMLASDKIRLFWRPLRGRRTKF